MTEDKENVEIVITDLISQGSFGKVYQGTLRCKTESEEPIAIKKIKLKSEGLKGLLEPIILRTVEHPYLASCLEIQSSPDHLYLIQELAPYNLNSFLREKRQSYSTLQHLAFCLAAAVRDLHSLGFIHADIKPENILVYPTSGQPVPKLTDFSLTVVQKDDQPHFNHIVCTANYRPPENFDREPWGKKLDIWSLGCTFYYLFFRSVLFPHQAAHEPKGKIESEEGRERCRLRYKRAFLDWEDYLRSWGIVIPPRPRDSHFSLSYSRPECDSLLESDENNELRNLLFRMLHPSPDQRPTAEEVCNHTFFKPIYFRLSFRVKEICGEKLSKGQLRRSKPFFERYLSNKLSTIQLAIRIYSLVVAVPVDIETTKIAACCWLAHKIKWGNLPSLFLNYERALVEGLLTTADPSNSTIAIVERQICNAISFFLPYSE